MTWLWVLIGIAVVVYIFNLMSGVSKEDPSANFTDAAMLGGYCMMQIF